MTQRNPNRQDDISVEAPRDELERLAIEQRVHPITDFEVLAAEFWPADEGVDDFVRTVRERRRI